MQLLERRVEIESEKKIIDMNNFRVDFIDNRRLSIRMKKGDKGKPKVNGKTVREDFLINFTKEETDKIKECLK